MFRPRPWVVASLSSAMVLAAAANLPGDEQGQEAAALALKKHRVAAAADLATPRLDQFDKYFALSIKPDAAALPHKADAHDLVVIFDTSASQNGEFRARATATLKAFLAHLNAGDKICLLAVDTSVVPMTAGGNGAAVLVAPQGKEIEAALLKLNDRVPLGATDMLLALRSAAAALADGKRPRAVVYIGDGMNIGGSVDAKELKEVIESLVSQRVPVSSYGVGPRVDAGLLARLANHTGGAVGFDNPQTKLDDQAAGQGLAAAATEVVVWSEKLELPASLSEVYPKRTPPLRGDRDTILIGVGKAVGPMQVNLSAIVAGEKKDFSWKITPSAPVDENAYLAKVVEGAQRDAGESLATVGTPGLLEARRLTVFQAQAMRGLAGQVMHVDPRLAQRLAQQAGKVDPDAAGERLIFVAQKAVQDGKAPGDGIVVDLGPGKAAAEPVPDGILGDEIKRRRILEQRLQSEVTTQLDQAARRMATDPQGALSSLKLLKEQVANDTVISPELKDSLLRKIDGGLGNVRRQSSTADVVRLQYAQAQATRAENDRLRRELMDREKKISQWMSKFDALMDEQKFTQAESVADLAMSVAPENSEIANAGLNATMRRAIEDGIFLRRQRIRGMLATLREVEYSHIPQPDEPPVVFPPKEWWDAMTKRREEYKAVSLASQSTAEKKIMDELQKPTTVEFNEQKLADVATYYSELHGINIQLDLKKLTEANVLETAITKALKGVTLKSALRLILNDLGLAYIVRDEVLLITTKEEADTFLVTKVYPVGDLVLPIVPAQQFGGGQQGGFGQQGGGGFGQGGGQQGGGGGQFGGGGGGQQGGGGFFSVPSSPFQALNPKSAPIKLDSPKRDARPAAPAAAQPAKPIDAKPRDGETQAKAWDRYFAGRKQAKEGDVQDDDLRATLRELRDAKQFKEIVVFIQTALRHGQSRPWMYEAMALAMFAADEKPEEIERTLMSAADYAANTTDLMYLAQYIYRSTFYLEQKARERFQARALKIFRQVSQLDPTAIDAYVHGLTVAKMLDDIDGIRWATVGLVGQAWGTEDRAVVDSASRIATATLQRLRADKRLKEAQEFEDAVNNALRRDVVVLVSWTGDADIDLRVQEPTGTMCWEQNPRTTSGGILIPNDLPGVDEKLQGRQMEAYVCPLGFDGKYRLMLHRGFGQPTAGKVKVEIIKHFKVRGENKVERGPETAEKWVEMGEKDVLLAFELEGGRRVETLKDEEIVRSVERAQQTRDEIRRLLWEATNVDSYARAMDAAQKRVAMDPRRNAPFRNRGVGYQPLIVVIPEGAQLFISAVISGDRRFVRTQVAPQFSFIAEVNVFNFATGEGMQTFQGNGGGQGGGGFGGGGFGGGGGNGGGGGQGGGGGGGFF